MRPIFNISLRSVFWIGLASLFLASACATAPLDDFEKPDVAATDPLDDIARELGVQIQADGYRECECGCGFTGGVVVDLLSTVRGAQASAGITTRRDGSVRSGYALDQPLDNQSLCAWFNTPSRSLQDDASASEASDVLGDAIMAAAHHVVASGRAPIRKPDAFTSQILKDLESGQLTPERLALYAAWAVADTANAAQQAPHIRALSNRAQRALSQQNFDASVSIPLDASQAFRDFMHRAERAPNNEALTRMIEQSGALRLGTGTQTGSVLDVGNGTVLKIAHLPGTARRPHEPRGQHDLEMQIARLRVLEAEGYQVAHVQGGTQALQLADGSLVAVMYQERVGATLARDLIRAMSTQRTPQGLAASFLNRFIEVPASEALANAQQFSDLHADNYACQYTDEAFANLIRLAKPAAVSYGVSAELWEDLFERGIEDVDTFVEGSVQRQDAFFANPDTTAASFQAALGNAFVGDLNALMDAMFIAIHHVAYDFAAGNAAFAHELKSQCIIFDP